MTETKRSEGREPDGGNASHAAESADGEAKATRRVRLKPIVLFPALAACFTLAADVMIPDTARLKPVDFPFFETFMAIIVVLLIACALATLFNKNFRVKFGHMAKFYGVLVLIVCALNLVTSKTELLPLIYFPDFDNIIAVYFEKGSVLLLCTGYSLRLLFLGIAFGGVIGFFTGLLIGWSERANYWLFPYFRFIGPIPSCIWIPLALLFFATTFQASVFIVALSMWFPTTILTCSGIQNVPKAYFDVSKTMGASTYYQITRIAIPAAFPTMFVGIFYGVITSLLALMSAEMIGSKYGIGWYLNWQQQVMSYADVYAAFLVIALICYVILKLLFAFRDKVLVWQEGTIRW